MLYVSLLLLTTVLAYTPSTPLFNKEHLNVYVNADWQDVHDRMDTDDRLILLVLSKVDFRSEQLSLRWKGFDMLILEVATKLEGGYFNTYYYDCEWALNEPPGSLLNLDPCLVDDNNFQPFFIIMKPPYARINPYDGTKTPYSALQFPGTEISVPALQKWILSQVPDYSVKLHTQSDFESFRDDEAIARVVLISSKQAVPQIYSALTATYRDKVRFAFVSEDSQAANQVKSFYGITSPAIILEQQGQITFYDGAMKLPQLVEWLQPYALATKRSDSQKDKEMFLKNELKSLVTVTTYDEFQQKVLSQESAAVVYFSTGDKKPHIATLIKFHEEHRSYINTVWYQVTDIDELKQNFRSASYLPMFRSFKNFKTGDEKRDTSTQVFLQDDDEYTSLVQEMSDNFDSEVRRMSEHVFETASKEIVTDELHPKFVVSYIFDDEIGPNLAFKALSVDPQLTNDFAFTAIQNPSSSTYRGEFQLPSVFGVMRKTDKYPAGAVFHFHGLQRVEFKSLKSTLLNLLPQDKVINEQPDKKDNRQVVEITSQAELKKRCLNKPWCGIGLFTGDNDESKIDLLQKLAVRGEKRTSPLYYSWINVTCHPEVLQWFDLTLFSVPTVLYYQPKHRRFNELIGTFDYETIATQEDKITISNFPAKVTDREMVLSKDCAVQEQIQDESDEDFQKMLAEILAEEEAAREQVVEKKKKTKKKKGKKSEL